MQIKILFHCVHIEQNDDTKRLKTSFNQSHLYSGAVSPGPHGRGRKLEENP